MTNERIIEVLAYIAKVLREDYGSSPCRLTEYESGRRNLVQGHAGFSHVLWMCEEAQRLMQAGRVNKACRWLGFVQSFLWCHHVFSITELKNMSRARPEGVTHYKVGDVLRLIRTPGVQHRITEVRPSGYAYVVVGEEEDRQWSTESTADPFYASGVWEITPPAVPTNLWPDATPTTEAPPSG